MITHDLNLTGIKPVTRICRELIKAGANPETPIEFIRGGTPVFHEKPLSFWAGLIAKEASGGRHMRFAKFTENET